MTVLSENQIIGTFQLTLIQYLNYQGSSRMMIESVRISRAYRGKGIGELVMKWTIDHAKKKNAPMLQLIYDKQRPDTIRFYEKLGFVASHEGFKLYFTKEK